MKNLDRWIEDNWGGCGVAGHNENPDPPEEPDPTCPGCDGPIYRMALPNNVYGWACKDDDCGWFQVDKKEKTK